MRCVGEMRNIVLCGKGSLCVKIFEWLLADPVNYRILSFVPTTEQTGILDDWDHAHRLLQMLCAKNGVKYINSGLLRDAFLANQVGANQNVEVISCFYKKIISADEIANAKRIINVHFSDLPKYRGARGINWALKNGEKFQGVTMHQVDEQLDHGPIYAQAKFEIFPERMEVIDVYKQCLEYAFILFKNTFPDIESIAPREQNHAESTYYSSADFERLGDRITFHRHCSHGGVDK